MWIYSLFVVSLCCSSTFSTTLVRRVIRQTANDSCSTPEERPGRCINIKQCPQLYKLIQINLSQKPDHKTFLTKSQCGKDKDSSPRVCCDLDANKVPDVTSPGTRGGNPPITPKPVGKDYSVCGRVAQTAEKVVGGHNATLGAWPWMVAIGYRRNANPTVTWECGGSLIADRWVVTAAHCVQNIGSLILTTARVGDLHLNNAVKDGASPVDITVDEIIPHPQYSTNPVVNDIALLRLRDPVTFTETIRPICLPAKDEYKSDEFYSEKAPSVAGWGHTEFRGTKSEMLQETNVDIVDREVCAEKYRTGGVRTSIDARTLCASRTGKDACQGDSGGPLMFPIGPAYHLIGIVSYGIGCANENFPGVYTRVAYFTDWISSTTGKKF